MNAFLNIKLIIRKANITCTEADRVISKRGKQSDNSKSHVLWNPYCFSLHLDIKLSVFPPATQQNVLNVVHFGYRSRR